jgi:hypothetical protein
VKGKAFSLSLSKECFETEKSEEMVKKKKKGARGGCPRHYTRVVCWGDRIHTEYIRCIVELAILFQRHQSRTRV